MIRQAIIDTQQVTAFSGTAAEAFKNPLDTT